MTKTTWLLLCGILIASTLLRVLPQIGQVFAEGAVYFKDVDTYYHMRLVDYCIANYPQLLRQDPYGAFGGLTVGYYPLMTLTISSIAMVIGGGQPSNYIVDCIAAWLPVLLGTVAIGLIFAIGKYVFNDEVGIAAAAIAAVTPTELLHRSTLGYPDHHVVEAVLFFALILSLWLSQKGRSWPWTVATGMALSLYFMNWWGSLVMMLLIDGWLIVEFLVLRKRQKDVKFLCLSVLCIVAIGTLVASPVIILWASDLRLYIIGLGLSLVLPVILLSLRKVPNKVIWICGISVTVVVASALVIGILWSPISDMMAQQLPHLDNLKDVRDGLRNFGSVAIAVMRSILATFWGFDTTISEAMPTDIQTALYNFGSLAIFFFIGLFVIMKKYRQGREMFIVMAVFLAIMTIGQRRWSYYGALPLSICAGVSMAWITTFFRSDMRRTLLVVIVVMSLLINSKATAIMAFMPGSIDRDWNEAMIWLKNNSDEPFDGQTPYTKESGLIKAKYTVMSWWDYGHWIIRIGQRVPLTSPTWQGIPGSGDCKFMTDPDLKDAEAQLKGWRVKYIVVDKDMVSGKYYAILSRYRAGAGLETTQEDIEKAYDNGVLVKLWQEDIPGYKVVYLNKSVKIFQVPQEVYGGPES